MSGLLTALVQVDVSVGALLPNATKMIRLAHEASRAGAAVIAFPELALSGYPPEDLVLKRHFMDDTEREIARLAAELPREPLVIVGSPRTVDDRVLNAALVFQDGALRATYGKMLLPNYGVFDEKRVFAPGARPLVIDVAGCRLGLHICEDSWYPAEAPCVLLADAGVDAVINISGSPYHRGKLALREESLHQAAARVGAPLLYCNLVGGQDELVFDGASMMLDGREVLARAKQFEEDILYVTISPKSSPPAPSRWSGGRAGNDWKKRPEKVPTIGNTVDVVAVSGRDVGGAHRAPTIGNQGSPPTTLRIETPLDDLAEVYGALRLGLKDYVDKNGFSHVIVAVSGGIDSALVATLAVDALGADRVMTVTMPSRFSSEATRGDAELLAKNLGVPLYRVPIEKVHNAILEEVQPLWPGRAADATEENVQARIRGIVVMALSNKFGWLVLTTGNKSEMATGYCTLYGDMAGGFAVIKDVPKTLVFDLARWRNTQGTSPIPVSTIERPPSAELREHQTDQDTLPPYDVLDRIIERYVERDLGADQIAAEGFDPDTVKHVIRMIDNNEYKRRQGAPGVKITPKAFGRDRRLPITNLYGERVDGE